MLHGLFVRKEKVGKPLKVTFACQPSIYMYNLVGNLISVNDEEKGGVETVIDLCLCGDSYGVQAGEVIGGWSWDNQHCNEPSIDN